MKLAKLSHLGLMIGLPALVSAGRAAGIELPVEKVLLTESPLPGYVQATTFCYTCHSAEYIAYQPRSSPRAYWKAQVTKMQKVFGAPVPDASVDAIVDYLVRTYGAERGAPAPAPTPPAKPAASTPGH